MAFCIQCGSAVGDQDQFCGSCGARQASPASPGAPPPADPAFTKTQDWSSSFDPRTASLLCYIPIIGWIPAAVVLASNQFRNHPETRFHAFQGLFLFVVYLIVDYILGPMLSFDRMNFHLEGLMKVALLGVWIFMLIRTSQGILVKLPILGELADRSVSEQR